MSWAAILKQYQDEYKQAEVSSFDELPDGRYRVRVQAARLKESKNQGIPMLEWEFVVAEGKYEGRHEWKYNLIVPDRIRWLKQDLFNAGLDLEELEKLEQELPQLLDRVLEIEIKTNKSEKTGKAYRNVYIRKVIDYKSFRKPDDSFAERHPGQKQPYDIADDDLPF
ncbi:DUF669 domain-containing protein [Paludifilum halophilum]|uniref:DUF669 domain-containing protein n=1 Tax=Paludifilum halophilum TaxID=1642702 RepID=A0A235B1H1_9BACL|nr:DUF669 domain-containing protein [Paludifilum halophilum]OYD06081.1 hypothetical protein CHM34_18225 [Paludifilum halophilum]